MMSEFVDGAPVVIPRIPRQYFWRPDLTNKTDELIEAVREELLGEGPRMASEKYVSTQPCEQHGKVSKHVHVRAYSPPEWFTGSGVHKKRREIELRGLPSFTGWRFITLTIDQAAFTSRGLGPLEAYLAGKDRMRRFLDRCREAGLWTDETPWAWKLEFHQSGWPHWHLLAGRTSKMSEAEMKLLTKLWGLGSTDVEMVRNEGFIYTFKYAFKPVYQRDESDEFIEDAVCVPDWFLDYMGVKTVRVENPETGEFTYELKPVSFTKVRFWQTSKGFYTRRKPEVSTVPKTQISWAVPQPCRVSFERLVSQVQVVARDSRGDYAVSMVVPVENDICNVWRAGSRAHTYEDGAAFGYRNYFLPVEALKQEIDNNILWKLHPLLNQNRLSLRHAMQLQTHGKCWKTS